MARLEKILGIESTAHTFGVSVVSSVGDIASDARSIFSPPPGKGIHPREAAQHHSRVASAVVSQALKESKTDLGELVAVAYSAGPGLGPALRVGASIARAISLWSNIPLVPVHHAIGHIEIALLETSAVDPLVVLVSGGHTCITALVEDRWRVFGETEDITLGNLIDSFAREAGLPSPAGKEIEVLASKGRELVDLPYTVKGNDVSYSGLLTFLKERLRDGVGVEDLCFSLQEVSFSMLTEATERALAHTGKRELILTGGVAANRRLQEMMRWIAEEHGARFCVVSQKLSGDSGAQIAWTGLLALRSGVSVPVERSFVRPKWRFDEVEIPWRRP